MKDIADLLARISISFIFFYEMYDILGFWKQNKITMTSYGITWNQDILLGGIILFLLVGGLMVLIGYYANFGAFLLLLYWLPFTLVVFSFWNDPDDVRRLTSLQFMRNMAICGGLLLLIANGSGKYSVRRLLHVLKLPDD